MTEDVMVGWHHQYNGHELGQIPRDGGGWGFRRVGHDLATEQQTTYWATRHRGSFQLSFLPSLCWFPPPRLVPKWLPTFQASYPNPFCLIGWDCSA